MRNYDMRTLILKKITKILLSCVMAGALFTGCDNNIKGNVTKIGTIKYINVTEDALAKANVSTYGNKKCEYIFFDNMNSMAAALNAGQIDEMSTYECVAKYLAAQNPNFTTAKNVPNVSDSFCCALRQEDTALKEEFDAAIKKLTDDGTLAKLVKTYITDADFSATPTAVDMPKFDGAPTVKIAVTGDLPPLDFVTADDKAAGFNTAMLAAVSQSIGKNFELVNVDGGARAAALNSELVDVIFWVAVPNKDSFMPPDCDKPDGAILTEPYFTDKIVHVVFSK